MEHKDGYDKTIYNYNDQLNRSERAVAYDMNDIKPGT